MIEQPAISLEKHKVLVANRGEIAIRILRACREMGIASVALFTDVDRASLHLRYADEAIDIGERRNYLNIGAVIDAALRSGATAIHPGYGFLSENAAFAKSVEAAGLCFIGPRPETIHLTGDKLESRRVAVSAGLPVLPGTNDPLPRNASADIATGLDYPMLVKATAGGGGRGIRFIQSPGEFECKVKEARQEALAAFGNDTVYLESLVQQARHIEVQILADGQGKVICLGERECSIQRRRQKLIEESPASNLSPQQRQQLFDWASALGQALNYRSLGTVEFLFDITKDQFYFIEINPRIQVEHPVTEMVTGLDLVRLQLTLALQGRLELEQNQVVSRGSAIEARITAEDVDQDFMPATGQINYLREPGGPGVRLDSALYQGGVVTADYDSLLAKVIVWDDNRPHAINRLQRALQEFQISGVPTALVFLQQILLTPQFRSGHVTTTFLEGFQHTRHAEESGLERELAIAAALYTHQRRQQKEEQQPAVGAAVQVDSHWKMAAWHEQMF